MVLLLCLGLWLGCAVGVVSPVGLRLVLLLVDCLLSGCYLCWLVGGLVLWFLLIVLCICRPIFFLVFCCVG